MTEESSFVFARAEVLRGGIFAGHHNAVGHSTSVIIRALARPAVARIPDNSR
jgi:hypothetical protein